MSGFELYDNPNGITVARFILPSIDTTTDEILLLERHGEHLRHQNKLELPGGQVINGTKDPYGALVEQILVKTGISVKIDDHNLSCVESRVMEDGNLYIGLVGMARYIKGNLRVSSEHRSGFWENPEYLNPRALTSQARKGITLYENKVLGIIDLAGPRAVSKEDLRANYDIALLQEDE